MKTRTALLASGALRALVGPKLAMDQKFDPSPLLATLSRKNLKAETAGLAAKVVRVATPLLAKDESLDVDDVVKVIGALNGAVPSDEADALPEETPAVDDDGDAMSKVLAYLKDKLSPEDMAAVGELCKPKGASDDGKVEGDPKPAEPPAGGGQPAPKNPKDDGKPAMDAALIRSQAESAAVARMQAMRVAEKDVLPHVGEVDPLAFDSAEGIYKFALEKAGKDLTGVHPSAFKAMVDMLPKPGATPAAKPTVAMDAAADSDFRSRFPTAGKLGRAF